MEPFEKHLASPGELGGSAAALVEAAAGAGDHRETTQGHYQPAMSNWSGMGHTALLAAPAPLRRGADETATALAWAGVCAQIWADRVTDFNAEVDRITGEIEALGSTWGATGSDGDPPTPDEISSARSLALYQARQRWWTAYNTIIRDGEDQVAAMLADGPTEEHLATATYHGGTVATVVSAITEGTVGAFAARLAGDLRRDATWLNHRANFHNAQYLNARDPASRAFHNQRALDNRLQGGQQAARGAGLARTVGARLPIIGLGITAAGVGYDVSQGKPVGQAVASGVGGMAAGMAAGAVVGSFIPVPIVGTLVGAAVGAGVGWAVSAGIDWAFENSDAISGAVNAGAEAIGNVAGGIADGAKDAWNSIFG